MYQYLKIWLEDDDELERIGQDYSSGKMLIDDVKGRLGDVLAELSPRVPSSWITLSSKDNAAEAARDAVLSYVQNSPREFGCRGVHRPILWCNF